VQWRRLANRIDAAQILARRTDEFTEAQKDFRGFAESFAKVPAARMFATMSASALRLQDAREAMQTARTAFFSFGGAN
jgi:hypothetical protein